MVRLLDENIDELVERFKNKEKRALARLISIVETYPDKSTEIFNKIQEVLGDPGYHSYVIGITGSPGAGKSTLTSIIAKKFEEKGNTIGIISVDPSSPYSGGAFLGDRVRMTELVMNPNIYIRSLASRGSTGGLSRATYDITLLMEAFGKDLIIIETVGAGQSEVDIARMAFTTVVVSSPALGDFVQVLKAGIIEIGDILIVNKSDLGGDDICVDLEMMLDTAFIESGWRPPVLRTNGITGEGVDELIEEIENHREYLELSGLLDQRRGERIRDKIKTLMVNRIERFIFQEFINEEGLTHLAENLIKSEFKVYEKVDHLMKNFLAKQLKKDN